MYLPKPKSLLSLIVGCGLMLSCSGSLLAETALNGAQPKVEVPIDVTVQSNVVAPSNMMFVSAELTGAVKKRRKAAYSARAAKVTTFNAEVYRLVFKDRAEMEQRVKKALRTFVGADDKPITITLVPDEPAKLLAGRFKAIEVEMRGAVVKTLRMDYAWARARNCSIDWAALLKQDKFRFKDGRRSGPFAEGD